MALTPAAEKELQLGLMKPAPPSSFVFLDLPPTPDVNNEAPQDDDPVLPYISRMLMEDDIDDKFFYQYPDHPALLTAQKPFAQILSDASSTSPDDALTICPCSSVDLSPLLSSDSDMVAAAVLSSGAQGNNNTTHDPAFFLNGNVEPINSLLPDESSSRSCMEMVSMAFFKGMEEANKFLPRDGKETVDGKARKKMLDGNDEAEVEADMSRSTKQMATPPQPESEEEAAARQMLDQLMLTGYDPSVADVQELRVAMEMEKPPPPRGRRGAGARNAVDLHTMLIRCAEALAANNCRAAADLLERIRRHSSPTGDGTQRLAHCFAEGLEARLAGTGSHLYRSLMEKRASVAVVLKAYQLYMAACCFLPVELLFCNKTICNVVAGRKKLHIVHYGLGHGFQWPDLLRWLAARDGGPPEVRLTGIDTPQPGFRPAKLIQETGRRLSDCARQYGVPFKFRGIAATSEAVRAEELDIDPDEVLAVVSLSHFRTLMDESVIVDRPNPRDMVLSTISKMRPFVFIHAVVNRSYSAAFLVTRFREALYNFTALFDMMDTVVPRDNDKRLLVERDIFARCAMNVIACEGADRVERPQSYKQWQERCQRAGLRQLSLDPDIVQMIKDKVKKEYHKYFVINEDQRWLLQGWKGRVLYALSTWTADDDLA